MSRTLVPVVVALAACSDPPPEASFTEDRRIDAADPGNDPDSIGTRMCTTDDGHVYVAWLDDRARDDGGVDLWMNRSADLGASWLPAPVQVNHGDGSVWNPALHCDDDGVYVVWEDDRDGELQMHQVYYNQSTDGGETFLPDDRRLDDDPDGGSMSIGPQITGDGRALFVVWSDGANGAYDVMLTRGSPDGDWTEPVRMDSDPRGSAHSGQARVAVGGGGVWVVWEDTRNG
ncbi:MAG: sialidase family protein, partial [Myxococcota bacterium]